MELSSKIDYYFNQNQTGQEKQKSQHKGSWHSKPRSPDQRANATMNRDIKQTYAYQNLDKSRNEIRLVTIYPGNHDDPLEIALNHVSLNPLPPQPPPQTLSLEKLQATLPPGWTVHQTVEERILFEGPDKTTTWVHPNTHVSPTACDIILNPFHDIKPAADYEALSYTWGSPCLSETLVVHSGLSSGTNPQPSILRIRPNLSEALRYLRLQDVARVVWVDALCINQNDLEEREQQVGRMANIYRRARKVIAWLGPDYDNAAKALQGLQYVGEQIEATNNYYIARSPGASEPTWHDPKKPLPFDSSFWATVIDLVHRPWFSRVWVIQEIHMGNINSFLKCGSTEIPWSLFQRTVPCLTMKGADFITRSHIGRLNTMCSLTPGKNFDFFLSILSHHNHCFDPRDFIYGILSLAPPELQKALCVDYSSDTQTVYKDFFFTYSSLQNRSDLLTFAGWTVAATETTGISRPWPSWVPDWRSNIPTLQGLLFTAASAPGQSCSEMVLGTEPRNSLRVKGVLLDETISTLLIKDIRNLAGVLEKFTTTKKKNTLKEAMPESNTFQIETVHKYIDAMHHGLTADRLLDPPVWVQTREMLRQEVFQNENFSLESDESPHLWWSNYKSFLDYWWLGTKLFLTNRGHPAVSKWEVQSGDAIFVPLGCVYPLAVRPTGIGGNTFKVIGPVYLDGVMDGEAFLGKLPDPWCVQYNISRTSVSDKVLYKNLETGTTVNTDPRLDKVPLPQEWEPVAWTRQNIDPRICCRFRNKLTGQLANYDPRMTSEALKGRGVNIKEIILV